MFKRSLNSLKEKLTKVRADYGILALAASIAVPLKLLLFYRLIGISVNFFLVWLITGVLTYILFASFKNKWIPAVVYLLLSLLMFCDVTYSKLLQPVFVGEHDRRRRCAGRYYREHQAGPEAVVFPDSGRRRTGDRGAGGGTPGKRRKTKRRVKAAGIAPAFEAAEASEDVSAIEPAIAAQDAKADASGAEPANAPAAVPAAGKNAVAVVLATVLVAVLTWVTGHKKQVAALIILCLLVFNSSASYLITSLSNQEIYSYHIKDVLNKFTGNGMLDKNANFSYSVTDSYDQEKNGPLFGVAKGKNLIVIQVESLQNLVINKTYNGQEITPNLNELIKGNTVYFDHYYQQIGSGNTSDAEFATNNSIYGTIESYTYKLFPDNYYRGLPVLLGEQGYQTAVLHAYEDRDFWNRENMYKSLGFGTFYGGIGGTDKGQFDMTEWMGWGLTDSEFFKQAITYLKELAQPVLQLYHHIVQPSSFCHAGQVQGLSIFCRRMRGRSSGIISTAPRTPITPSGC